MHQCLFRIRWGKKAFYFDNFENSHNSFLWPQYFIDYFCENGFHVRVWHPSCVYFSAQRQYTAVQKSVHLWNNFPYICTLIRQSFQGYRCESGIAIFIWRVIWNYAYSPFKDVFSGACTPGKTKLWPKALIRHIIVSPWWNVYWFLFDIFRLHPHTQHLVNFFIFNLVSS